MYVSNAESVSPDGGVGSLTFNSDGEVINYEKIVTFTTMNCGGGATSKRSSRDYIVYKLVSFDHTHTVSLIFIKHEYVRQDILGNMGNM